MDFINKPIAWLLEICYSFTFNYALALLVFAFFMKIILLPLGIKQHSNSLKQASLRPKEAAIVKKYKGRNDRASQQKRQMEIQELQQRAGYSQLAGCLPMLIQLPIIIFIYNVIRSPLTYLCGLTKDAVTAVKNVAAGILGTEAAKLDEIAVLANMRADINPYLSIEGVSYDALPKFDVFGIDLSQTPEFGANILMLIPLLTFVLTFLTSKLTRKLSYQSPVMQQQTGDAKLSMTIMDLILPLISTWITFSVPGVIGLYWMYQSLLGVLQQFIMVKIKPYPVFTEEDYKEAEREVLGKKKKLKTGLNKSKDPDRPRVRSLHHIDDDEYNAKVVMPENDGIPTESKASADPKGLLSPIPMKEYKKDKSEK